MNTNLNAAKTAKNDEFYTQYEDIEKEVAAYVAYDPDVFRDKTVLLPCDDPERSNFTKYFLDHFNDYGIGKLVSTCISQEARMGMPLFYGGDGRGKYMIRRRGYEPVYGLLSGGGDFRSVEITELRDAADVIVTNPPFSLFREFIAWIRGGWNEDKKFLVIGNMNAAVHKDIFPLIKESKIWLGTTSRFSFETPDGYLLKGQPHEKGGKKYTIACNTRWFTNLEHGHRHEPLRLMTMAENKAHSRHKEVRGHDYQHYDNYDAMEVPFVDAIPSDYDGVIGVPASFLDKYNPEQFEILSSIQHNDDLYRTKHYSREQYEDASLLDAHGVIMVNGVPKSVYTRILIRHKHPKT